MSLYNLGLGESFRTMIQKSSNKRLKIIKTFACICLKTSDTFRNNTARHILAKGLMFYYTKNVLTFFFFWLHLAACGILVPQPGNEPGATTVKAPSPKHWTAREFPKEYFKNETSIDGWIKKMWYIYTMK